MNSKRFRRLPSPAFVIASIALILAVGGGSFALAITDKKSDKKIAKKAANKQITKRAPRLSVKTASNLGGSPPSAFAPSTVVRTAAIASDGTVDAARSDGIVQANVTHDFPGLYCINGISPAPKSVLVSGRLGGSSTESVYAEVNPSVSQPCNPRQIGVVTLAGGAPSNQPFWIFVH
jgi:hypothetical protein